jgi:uncharacterized membrane protein (UPF0127 family)
MTSIRVARGLVARMRGLAFAPPGDGLEIPRCNSIHTFGMRYPLDLIWIDADRRVVRIDRDVPPRRVRGCRGARSVIEVPAGGAEELVAREGAVMG